MSNNLPKLLAIDYFTEEPDINSRAIKELLDYTEEESSKKDTLLDFAEFLWNAKNAVIAAIRTSSEPSVSLCCLCGVFETIEVLINEKLVTYKHAEISEMPFATNIIDCIYHNEGIRDEQIADKLNVDINKITDALHKLVVNNMITYSRPGKYMYYYLTNEGKRYYTECVLPS